jgi:hypothetical protein
MARTHLLLETSLWLCNTHGPSASIRQTVDRRSVLRATELKQIHENLGSHGGKDIDDGILGCNAMWAFR